MQAQASLIFNLLRTASSLALSLSVLGCSPDGAAPGAQQQDSGVIAQKPDPQTPGKSTPEPGGVPQSLKDLEAKLKPAQVQPTSPAPPKQPAGKSEAPIPDAEKLQAAAAETALSLASAIGNGELETAKGFCVEGKDLLAVLKPSYHAILSEGIPSQNLAALELLVKGLRGKKWKPELVPGKLSRSAPHSSFVENQVLLSGTILRMESEGARIEAHLEQMVLIGDHWRVFKLSAP